MTFLENYNKFVNRTLTESNDTLQIGDAIEFAKYSGVSGSQKATKEFYNELKKVNGLKGKLNGYDSNNDDIIQLTVFVPLEDKDKVDMPIREAVKNVHWVIYDIEKDEDGYQYIFEWEKKEEKSKKKGDLPLDKKILNGINSMEISSFYKIKIRTLIENLIKKLEEIGVSGYTEIVNIDSKEKEIQIGVMIDYEETFGEGWGEDVDGAFDKEVEIVEKSHSIAEKLGFKVDYNEENPQDFTNWTVFSLKVNA